MYSWKDGLENEVKEAEILPDRRVDWRFVWHALSARNETYLFVGWPGRTVRVTYALMWATRRRFIYWSDYPSDFLLSSPLAQHHSFPASVARRFLYHVVRTTASRVFLVGQHTVEAFAARGWPRARLANLPVCVSLPEEPSLPEAERRQVRQANHVHDDDLFLLSGSRLEWSKGFDVLVLGCAVLKARGQRRFRVVIVGDGAEREALERLVAEHALEEHVFFERWLEPSAFERLVRACDVYVHAARFDAFGGGTLMAMACGKPVVGSEGAGSAAERVVDGENGYLYACESAEALAAHLERFLDDPSLAGVMGSQARATALEWPPERSAGIVLDAMGLM
jgi:glycosyltransferase involved in cell wall biosynthesis